jgi:hypothetical protein
MNKPLFSLDIDGTLDIGDPPGPLQIIRVKRAIERGCIVGSCSDRPLSTQRRLFAEHGITVEFAVSKHMLDEVKARFSAHTYYHVGDREDLDKRYALLAGFEFLWPHESTELDWFD